MDVQKFEAFNMQDAIKLVKQELGRDAVILSTREKTTTQEGTGKPIRMIEVTAAPAASNSKSITSSKNKQIATFQKTGLLSPEQAAMAQRAQFPRFPKKNEVNVVKGLPTLGQLNPATRDLARSIAGVLEPSEQATEHRAPYFPPSADFSLSDATTSRKPSLSKKDIHLDAVTAKFEEKASDEVRMLREELGRVRREIEQIPHVNVTDQMQEIRVMLHDLMRQRHYRNEENIALEDESLNDICIRLRAAGVLEAIIAELTHVLMSGSRPTQNDGSPLSGEKLKEHYLNQSIRFLFRQMSVTPQLNFNNQRVVALVGPTGVGKTTTIAKLAARLQLSDNKRVALVSMDSFRIAAADQLRAYSKILDCPFTEVSDLDDLANFVAKFYNYDAIFIDTAGRSSKHNSQMEQLKQINTLPFPVHFHMVQSASMKQRDLDENLKAFRVVNPQSLIFTKLDESWSFGEILNTNIKSKIPLSFFTTGQKVPEDLEPATKERVVERIFRL